MFINKTVIELCVLSVLISAIGTFLFTHTYFEIRDVRIEGLDAYASEKAKKIITEELSRKVLKLPANNYLLFNTDRLASELENTIAVESLSIEQKFPHSLIIHATERPVAVQFSAPNGVAYVAPDGKLVRWYEPHERIDRNPMIPIVRYGTEISDHKLFAQVIESRIIESVTNSAAAAHKITKNKFSGALLKSGTDDTITLEFNPTPSIVIRINADLTVQLKKAEVSAEKFPNAVKIDVRFADKVFVTF